MSDREHIDSAELEELRRRISQDPNHGNERLDEATTLEEIAEATEMPVEDVRAHLRQIRAERAFSAHKEKKPVPVLAITGLCALAFASAVTWSRLQQAQPGHYDQGRTAQITISSSQPAVFQRKVEPVKGLVETNYAQIIEGSVHPPLGLKVAVIGRSMSHEGQGDQADIHPLQYEFERQSLAAAAEQLIEIVRESDQRYPTNLGSATSMSDAPKMRYTMSGWPGTEDGFVDVPLDPIGRKQLLESATKLLAKPKEEQAKALNTNVAPTRGVVLPPPGFQITFAGRRTDVQVGPRLLFADPDPSAVRKRLELALRNAFERDRRPPVGEWSANAVKEAKIPAPAYSHVEVSTSTGIVSFDLPSRHAWGSGAEQVFQREVGRALKLLDPINERARLTPHAQNTN